MTYSYSSTPLYVSEGQSIQFRYEAPAGFDELLQVRIEIGDLTVFWLIETKLEDFEPDPYEFQDVDPAENGRLYTYAETVYPDDGVPYTGAAGETPALRAGEQVVTITGLDPGTQAPLLIASNVLDATDYAFRIREWNGSSYNSWGSWTRDAGLTMSNLDQIQLRLTAADGAVENRYIDVGIGTGSARWNVKTSTIPVNCPFPRAAFGTTLDRPINYSYAYSDIPQITGLTSPAVITAGSGIEVAISNYNTTFTNAAGDDILDTIDDGWGDNLTVTNGQYVQLRATTTSISNFEQTFNITIGDCNDGGSWTVGTGEGENFTPDTFAFVDLLEQEPGGVDYVSTAVGSVDNQNRALIAGLTDGTEVDITLREADTTPGVNPRIKVNGGSPGLIQNVVVSNDDYIELVMDGSTDVVDPINNPGAGVARMAINVGDRAIVPWTITNWAAPDTTPEFTPINEVLNRTPGGISVIGPIGLTGFNQEITISATSPLAYNEFDFATGEDVGTVLFSVNGAAGVAGPLQVQPDYTGNPVNITIIMQQPGNANIDPVVGLSHSSRTTITFGDATPFNLRSVNYAVKPIPPAYLGVWYTEKNASFDADGWVAAGEDPTNAKDYYRQPKFDGYSIGTVIPVPKETVVDDGNYGYGTLEDRFPGFLECDGRSLAAADYPWLFDAIGNQYGGSAQYVEATSTYSGNFNLPDYRGVRMVGRGIVDANRGSSAFVPVTSAGGSYELPGSTGGWWYVDDVDIAGTNPLEQVIAPAGQEQGTESEYFSLGTTRTSGTELLTADVEFTVTGAVSANIGPISDVTVRVPSHEHFFVTSETDSPNGDPVIPWGTRAFYGTGFPASAPVTSDRGSDSREPDGTTAEGYWDRISLDGFDYNTFVSEVGDTDGSNGEDVFPPSGRTSVSYGNYWGSPLASLTAELAALTGGTGTTPPGTGSPGTGTDEGIPGTPSTPGTPGGTITEWEIRYSAKFTDPDTDDPDPDNSEGGTGGGPGVPSTGGSWHVLTEGYRIGAPGGDWDAPPVTSTFTVTEDLEYVSGTTGSGSGAEAQVTFEPWDIGDGDKYTRVTVSVTDDGVGYAVGDTLTIATWRDTFFSGGGESVAERLIRVSAVTEAIPDSGGDAATPGSPGSPGGADTPIVDPGVAYGVDGKPEDYFEMADGLKPSSTGDATDAGVIDTSESSGRIDNYQSYESTKTHSHLIGTDPVNDPNSDYSYGNVNGSAELFREGLATFDNFTTITFNQSDVGIELNTGTFSWNNSSKPVPTPKMDPQRKVPIVTPFHKMKYIIKAY